jgi:hypothetical protein
MTSIELATRAIQDATWGLCEVNVPMWACHAVAENLIIIIIIIIIIIKLPDQAIASTPCREPDIHM